MRTWWPAWAILALVLLAQAVALWPEWDSARAQSNDRLSHLAITKRIVAAVQHGENPLDCWSSEFSLGFPQVRTYMILPHLGVAAAYFALGKMVPIENVLLAFHWLAVWILPLSFFICAAWLGLDPRVAAAAAVIAPLVATDHLYGIDYASYVSAGWGLFPQAVAVSFLLLAIGCADRVFRGRAPAVAAAALLSCTFLSHFMYGYVGAVSIAMLAVIRGSRPGAARIQVRRLFAIAGISAMLCAWQILPIMQDSRFLNHSRWEEAYKWNSFGAEKVLRWLFTGQLLDFGRIPVITLLAAGGLLIGVCKLIGWRRIRPSRLFVMAGALIWVALFCGRPLWGRSLILLGIMQDFHLHRLIGVVHIFLVLLAAMALSALWRLSQRWGAVGTAGAVAVSGLILYPAISERVAFLADNRDYLRELNAKFENSEQDIDRAAAFIAYRGGRFSPLSMSLQSGQPGAAMATGSRNSAFWIFLENRGLPMVPYAPHASSLTQDVLGAFQRDNQEVYRQYNIKTFVLQGELVDLPPFLNAIGSAGSLRLYEAPGTGYFAVVQAPAAVGTTRENFLDVVQPWLSSPWPLKKAYLWLDFGDAPADLPHLRPGVELGDPPLDAADAGRVLREERQFEVYAAEYEAAQPAFVVFRMTWHPNWKVTIDGKPEKTMMLSPGVLGVRTPPGKHQIICRYQPGMEKAALLISGILVATAIAAFSGGRGKRTRAIKLPATS